MRNVPHQSQTQDANIDQVANVEVLKEYVERLKEQRPVTNDPATANERVDYLSHRRCSQHGASNRLNITAWDEALHASQFAGANSPANTRCSRTPENTGLTDSLPCCTRKEQTAPIPIGIGPSIPAGAEEPDMLCLPDDATSIATLHAASVDLIDDHEEMIADQNAAARWFAAHAQADRTLDMYESRWRYVLKRCNEWRAWPLPMETRTACYLIADMAMRNYSLGYIRNTRNTIRKAHRLGNHADPTVAEAFLNVYDGIARELGNEHPNRKVALLAADMHAIADAVRKQPFALVAVQEWAYICAGYYGALRRSEIVALNARDLRFTAEGVNIVIRRSKTDQYGRSAEIFVGRLNDEYSCGVAALERWIRVARISDGALFRRIYPGARVSADRLSAITIARGVQRYARTLGIDAKLLGAHSLRAGFITQALLNGVAEVEVAAHTRHESIDPLSVYYRPRTRRNLSTMVVN